MLNKACQPNTSSLKTHPVKKLLSVFTIGVVLLTTPLLANSKEVNVAESSQEQAVVKEQTVNLNKSSLEQLLTLKGIGYSRAQSIIVYREQMGGFKSVDELSQVSGVGEKIMSENRARLTI
ncbi:ComEA family DNA-binding protein [Colwellia echini]|uniref:ComEA family DNA-binding protein n=1 Tax=Colwellia echini TaxID=1982103 RepID=A0ABY3MUD3_9GAMM|nr:ComEA family DNA-binding protein [Colwellia echini]TYK64813.1 ComEA family DNA-binding protein [Colwellia echini]